MIDALSEMVDLLEGVGMTVYRGQLPKGFDNSEPAVVVAMVTDDHHQTSATRRVMFAFRVYGGSASATVCATWYNALCDRVSNARSGQILSVGDLSGQELPADPVTGWPAYLLRASARIIET